MRWYAKLAMIFSVVVAGALAYHASDIAAALNARVICAVRSFLAKLTMVSLVTVAGLIAYYGGLNVLAGFDGLRHGPNLEYLATGGVLLGASAPIGAAGLLTSGAPMTKTRLRRLATISLVAIAGLMAFYGGLDILAGFDPFSRSLNLEYLSTGAALLGVAALLATVGLLAIPANPRRLGRVVRDVVTVLGVAFASAVAGYALLVLMVIIVPMIAE